MENKSQRSSKNKRISVFESNFDMAASTFIREPRVSTTAAPIQASIFNLQDRSIEAIEILKPDTHPEAFVPVAPDGGYSYVILIAAFLTQMSIDGVIYSFGLLYPELIDQFNESAGKTALIGVIQNSVYQLIAPFSASLINRFGCRAVAFIGAVMASFALLVSSFIRSVNGLICSYGILAGIFMGIAYLPCVIIVSYYFERKRGIATSMLMCGGAASSLVIVPTTNQILLKFGWVAAMIFLSSVLLHSCVYIALMRPLRPLVELKKFSANRIDKTQAFMQRQEQAESGQAAYDNQTFSKLMEKSNENGSIFNLLSNGMRDLTGSKPMSEGRRRSISDSLAEDLQAEANSTADSSYNLSLRGSQVGQKRFTGTPKRISVVHRKISRINAQTIAEEEGLGEDQIDGAKTNSSTLGAPSDPTNVWITSNQEICSSAAWFVDGKSQAEKILIGPADLQGSAITLATASLNPVGSCLQMSKDQAFAAGSALVIVQLPHSDLTYEDYARPMYRKDVFLTCDPAKFVSSKRAKSTSNVMTQSSLSMLIDPDDLQRSQFILNTLTSMPLTSSKDCVEQFASIPNADKLAGAIKPSGVQFFDRPSKCFNCNAFCYRICVTKREQEQNRQDLRVDDFAERIADQVELASLLDDPNGKKESFLLRPLRRHLRLWILKNKLNKRNERRHYEYQSTMRLSQRKQVAGNYFAPIVNVLRSMFDLTLFKKWEFLLIVLANILKTFGGYAPTIYYSKYAEHYHFPKASASWPMTAFGVASLSSRLIFSLISDLAQIKPIIIVMGCCFSWSFAFATMPFVRTFVPFVASMAWFGCSLGPPIAFTAVILCDFVGLDRLTNAMGLVTLSRGLSSLIGNPLAAYLTERDGDFVAAYYVVGVIPVAICTCCYFTLYFVKLRQDRLNKLKNNGATEKAKI